jgi:hypothetical protein
VHSAYLFYVLFSEFCYFNHCISKGSGYLHIDTQHLLPATIVLLIRETLLLKEACICVVLSSVF